MTFNKTNVSNLQIVKKSRGKQSALLNELRENVEAGDAIAESDLQDLMQKHDFATKEDDYKRTLEGLERYITKNRNFPFAVGIAKDDEGTRYIAFFAKNGGE